MKGIPSILIMIICSMLIVSQVAPHWGHLFNGELMECINIEESETDEKKTDEEKDKISSQGLEALIGSNGILASLIGHLDRIPPSPYLETISPPPDYS